MNELCFEYDEWLKQKDKTLWIAETDQGTVYQDDGRPGTNKPAWERLILSGLKIKSMRIQFRSHVEHVGEDKDGYYFINSIFYGFGMKKPNNYYICGYLENGIVKCKKWKVPELIIEEEFDRSIEDCGITESGLNLLIRN